MPKISAVKLLPFLFIFAGSFFSSAQAATNPTQAVFKISAYSHNALTDSFSEEQYGSAIYVDRGLVYTNAHVVLDDDDVPLGNYRVCKTENFKERPKCFSTADLLYYDTKNDLAVLRISDPNTVPLSIAKAEPNIGD